MRHLAFLTIFLVCKVSFSLTTFWSFIDSAAQNHPDSLYNKASVNSQQALVDTLGWWDDPIIEVSQIKRSSNQDESTTVHGVALRQKLPFWSAKSLSVESQKSVLESLKSKQELNAQKTKNELVLKLYTYARLLEEQKHLKERRSRLQVIRNSITKTKSASPSQTVERELISAASNLTEQEFDSIDAETTKLKAELTTLGLAEKTKVDAKWVTKKTFSDFMQDLKKSNKRVPAQLKAQQSLVKAAESHRDSLLARPEFDAVVQMDQERGGPEEKNLYLGLAVKVPMNALFGVERKVADAEVIKTQAELVQQQHLLMKMEKQFNEEAKLIEKSLDRFNMDKIVSFELAIDKAEKNARQGWVPINQLLELEKQAHAQVEKVFDVQLQTVDFIGRACSIFECDSRQYLDGKL